MKKLTEEQMYLAACDMSETRAVGYSLSQALAAGYSLSEALAAGYSLSEARAAGYSKEEIEALEARIPLVEKPYTKIWQGIKSQKRIHNQGTWGPDVVEEPNICNTPMCTAGHLVNLGGEAGYKLKDEFHWPVAAGLIHYKAHPNFPAQNFNSIPQELAMAYIKHMARIEGYDVDGGASK